MARSAPLPPLSHGEHHNAHSSLGRIPLEIGVYIVEYAALSATVEGDLSATITAVNKVLLPAMLHSCSILRSAALKTPFIWSFVEVIYLDRGCLTITSWDELLTHFRLSKQHDFDLLVHTNLRVPVGQYFQKLSEVLWQHLHRCRRLEIVECGFEVTPLFPLRCNMPRLHWASFSSSVRQPFAFLEDYVVAPALQNVTWTHPPFSPPHPGRAILPTPGAHASISCLELRLGGVTFTNALEFATSLANLRVLKMTCFQGIGHVFGSHDVLEFGSLEVLDLNVGLAPNDSLQSISAPKLTSLQVTTAEGPFPTFLGRSNFPNLRTLHIAAWPAFDLGTFQFILTHQTLHTLSFPLNIDAETSLWMDWIFEMGVGWPYLETVQIFSQLDDESCIYWFVCSLARVVGVRPNLHCCWCQGRSSMPPNSRERLHSLLQPLGLRWAWETPLSHNAQNQAFT